MFAKGHRVHVLMDPVPLSGEGLWVVSEAE